jgi:hypothetical protein
MPQLPHNGEQEVVLDAAHPVTADPAVLRQLAQHPGERQPVSSSTVRARASASVSPGSTWPPGRSQ